MKPSPLLLSIAVAVIGLVACNLSDADECTNGESGCDGNVARVCEYFKDASCDKEGGCYPNGSRWEWKYTDCNAGGGMCVADGICTKETKPDPRCGSAKHVCDGLTSIECAAGFAISESNGRLELRADTSALRVGETRRLRIERVSECGKVDETSVTPLESSAPDVLRIDVDRTIVARSPGKASVTTTNGVVLATFEVRRACADIRMSDAPESIVVSPDPNDLAPGETQKLAATAFFADDCMSELRSEDEAEWTSDDEAVARVDAGGTVTGVAQGKAIVRARWRGVTANGSSIYVRP